MPKSPSRPKITVITVIKPSKKNTLILRKHFFGGFVTVIVTPLIVAQNCSPSSRSQICPGWVPSYLYFGPFSLSCCSSLRMIFYWTIVLLLKLFLYCFLRAHFRGCVLRRLQLKLQLTVCIKAKPSVSLVIYCTYSDQYSQSDFHLVIIP